MGIISNKWKELGDAEKEPYEAMGKKDAERKAGQESEFKKHKYFKMEDGTLSNTA
jgi:hypothetical protein